MLVLLRKSLEALTLFLCSDNKGREFRDRGEDVKQEDRRRLLCWTHLAGQNTSPSLRVPTPVKTLKKEKSSC